jgi:lipoyl(octanoyl) transferase
MLTFKISPGSTNKASATEKNSRPSRARTDVVSSHALESDILVIPVPFLACLAYAKLEGRAQSSHVAVMDLAADIEWRESDGPVAYEEALAFMERRAVQIREGEASECVWLLEHPPLFTAGTSADPAELINPLDFPVFEAGRGGRYTYHGPGQRVGYVMLDLEKRGKDIRRFVHSLEQWMIDTLAELGVSAHRAPGRIGIWVGEGADEAKIGALGVRVKRWVTLHGFALNVAPDLSHFGGIVPCGIADFGVTSLAELGKQMPLETVDSALKRSFRGFLNGLEQPCKVS